MAAPLRVHPVADRAGFTLIELLVAVVLGSVIITVLFQLIAGQGRFVEMQGAREEVQQNSRAAIELIASELRTLPDGNSLVRAASDSITLRSARVWGVVCAVTGGTSIDVIVPAVTGSDYGVNTGTGVVVNVGTAALPDWTNAVQINAIGGAAADCQGDALPAGAERRSISMAGMPQSGATQPAAGNILYIYDQVTYRTGTSSGIPGRWIQRRVGDTGASTNQPMAGPIDEETGLEFQYFAGSATTALATPILDEATRNSVTRVVVAVDAVSRASFGDDRLTKSDTVVVALRNRL